MNSLLVAASRKVSAVSTFIGMQSKSRLRAEIRPIARFSSSAGRNLETQASATAAVASVSDTFFEMSVRSCYFSFSFNHPEESKLADSADGIRPRLPESCIFTRISTKIDGEIDETMTLD
jgi:hypothetical protein